MNTHAHTHIYTQYIYTNNKSKNINFPSYKLEWKLYFVLADNIVFKESD